MKEKLHFLFGSCTEKTKLIFITLYATHTDPMFKKKKKKLQQFQTVILKKKEKKKSLLFLFFFCFRLCQNPPFLSWSCLMLKMIAFCFLFFSRDFTKAFGFTLVLSFLSRQKKKKEKWGRENETEPWPKPFLSFWSLF